MTKRFRQCVVPKRRRYGKSLEDEVDTDDLPCPGPSMSVLFCNLDDCPPTVFEWTPWTTWTTCSEICGNDGIRKRNRECKIVPSRLKSDGLVPLSNDAKCPGKDKGTGECNIRPCWQWAIWGSWTPCSATCGEGKQSRRRTCEHIDYNASRKVFPLNDY